MASLAGSAAPRRSQAQQILDLLTDGEWWTTRELLLRVPSIIHSRVAELRAKGYAIEHEQTGLGAGGHRYRLVSLDEAGASGVGPMAPVSSSESGVDEPVVSGSALTMRDDTGVQIAQDPALVSTPERPARSVSPLESRQEPGTSDALSGDGTCRVSSGRLASRLPTQRNARSTDDVTALLDREGFDEPVQLELV